MTSDITLGEVILPGILAVVVYVVALAALILGRRWSTGTRAERQPSKEPRLRVIVGGLKQAANRA